jgi:hypothetical protein
MESCACRFLQIQSPNITKKSIPLTEAWQSCAKPWLRGRQSGHLPDLGYGVARPGAPLGSPNNHDVSLASPPPCQPVIEVCAAMECGKLKEQRPHFEALLVRQVVTIKVSASHVFFSSIQSTIASEFRVTYSFPAWSRVTSHWSVF